MLLEIVERQHILKRELKSSFQNNAVDEQKRTLLFNRLQTTFRRLCSSLKQLELLNILKHNKTFWKQEEDEKLLQNLESLHQLTIPKSIQSEMQFRNQITEKMVK